jgi:hypothetical protein
MPFVTGTNETEDDALEQTREEDTTNSVGKDSLPEDNDRPAAPPDPPNPAPPVPLSDDHPLTDTDNDQHELYDEGNDALLNK